MWEASDITAPQEADDSLNSIGFTGESFPESGRTYDIEMYRNQLGKPVLLPLVNEVGEETDLSRFGLMPTAIDEDFVGSTDDYNGLSGAPVIGDGLVGVHSQSLQLPAAAFEQTGCDEFMPILYTRADILPRLFP